MVDDKSGLCSGSRFFFLSLFTSLVIAHFVNDIVLGFSF